MSRLIPDPLKTQMIKNSYDTQNEIATDHAPVIKLFCANATWLLSELDPFDEDTAFGLCDLGMGEPELGYVSIHELETTRHPRFGFKVEQDLHFTPSHPMSVYAEAARMCQQITEDPDQLAIAQRVLRKTL